MIDTETGKTYLYAGGALTTNPLPKTDVTVTYSSSKPSQGTAVTGTLSALGVVQGGYSLKGGFFGEGGLDNSAGGALGAYYAFGPYDLENIVNVLDIVLTPYDVACETYEDISDWARGAYERTSGRLQKLVGRKKGS